MRKICALPTALSLCCLLVLLGCSSAGLHDLDSPHNPESSARTELGSSASTVDKFGLLVMAHGGSEEWNQGVLDAVVQLGERFPVEVAFGMASPQSLQDGVQRLEADGVQRIGVVRLFVSGESFLERTQKILGVTEGGSPKPAKSGTHGHSKPSGGMAHGMGAPWRIETSSSFALSHEGLSEAKEMGAVLLDRAKQLSHHAATEDVLILAHGPGDDAENQRWIRNITARTAPLQEVGFRRVQVMTLREDWHKKRAVAEEQIRAYVERANKEGGRALVIPFRVQGFGPYASVLEDLNYISDGVGLIPHGAVAEWMARQAKALQAGDFEATVQ